MADQNTIKQIVSSLLAERFTDIEIISVDVREDVDDDGDEIIAISVVFNGKAKKLDASKTSGLIRRLRPRLAEIDETGFPIFSFIAQSELGKNRTEAA